MSKQNWNLFW